MNLSSYRTLVFDCDGVVLNSNKIKTEAFYRAALPYGEQYARELVLFHVNNGGVSRYSKFEFFLTNIIPMGTPGPDLNELLNSYSSHVWDGLLACEAAPWLNALRAQTAETRWMIVSGGDQHELREIFSIRGISHFFDAGIFGSPDKKEAILQREILNHSLQLPALFIGDSRYDHIAAKTCGIDFIFMRIWTEFESHEQYCSENKIISVLSLSDLLNKSR